MGSATRRASTTVTAVLGLVALLLSVLGGASLPASAAEVAPGHASPPPHDPAAATTLQTLPPPTHAELGSGSWEPSPETRILVETQAPDDLVAEAHRLADELAALGILAAAPAVLSADRAGDPTPHDILLSQSTDVPPTLKVSEHPTLQATSAESLFRLSRALLQQLVATGSIPDGTFHFTPGSPLRSVHLDVARKHYPIEQLRQLLADMSWVGMNELELHFSEFEGFAIENDTAPEIASPDAYTKQEIRDIVAAAEDLHITVTPSFDMPGHLEHTLAFRPEFRLKDGSGGDVWGALDITSPQAVGFAHDLIREMAELFPAGTWNLGADEFLDFDSVHDTAALTAHAQQQHGPSATAYDALTAFVNDTAALLAELGFTTRVWSDGMLRSEVVTLDPSIEVAHWTQRPAGAVPADEFAAADHPLVNVNDEYLYFVLGERVGYQYPTGEAIYSSWDAGVFASVDDAPVELDADSGQVRGGMFAIWSDIPEALTPEQVVDHARTPIAAMATKLWSPDPGIDWSEFQSRLARIPRITTPAPTPEELEGFGETATPSAAPSPTTSTAPGSITTGSDEPFPVFVLPLAAAAAGIAITGATVGAASRRRTRRTP